MAVAIVSDSACDLGSAAAEAGVALIAWPPPADAFAEVFGRITGTGDEVVCITVSSALSKACAAAREAASAFGDSVRVVDSKTVSGGIALLAEAAVRMARGGKDAARIVVALDRWIATQQAFLIYRDYHLSPNKSLVPLVRINARGLLDTEATAKSWDDAQEFLIRTALLRIRYPAVTHVAIVAKDAEDADLVRQNLDTKCGHQLKELAVYAAGPAVETAFGPGFLGIFMREDR